MVNWVKIITSEGTTMRVNPNLITMIDIEPRTVTSTRIEYVPVLHSTIKIECEACPSYEHAEAWIEQNFGSEDVKINVVEPKDKHFTDFQTEIDADNTKRIVVNVSRYSHTEVTVKDIENFFSQFGLIKFLTNRNLPRIFVIEFKDIRDHDDAVYRLNEIRDEHIAKLNST